MRELTQEEEHVVNKMRSNLMDAYRSGKIIDWVLWVEEIGPRIAIRAKTYELVDIDTTTEGKK